MSETSQILVDMATRLFEDQFPPQEMEKAEAGHWLADQWAALEEMGLTLSLVPEDAGGFGLDMVEALNLIRLAGCYAVPLPLPETMVACWLLSIASIELPTGPISIASSQSADRISLEKADNGWRLKGTLNRIPWGRNVEGVALVAEHQGKSYVAYLPAQNYEVIQDINLAGEPRDTLNFDTTLPVQSVALASQGITTESWRDIGAAIRSIAMAGAIKRILEMTCTYVGERKQFGRPLSKFQAVQHNLAILAGLSAAASAGADMAAEGLASGVDQTAIAAAKIRAGEAAGSASAIAHQMHGAMGFTYEHSLHFFTKRLWSWREEFGHESEWSRLIGRKIAKAGADQLWPQITAIQSTGEC